jgi:hypothetical protein
MTIMTPLKYIPHGNVLPFHCEERTPNNIKYYHPENNCGKYADGLYNYMINDEDGHIPSPLITVTCTALRHALLEWQQSQGFHPKASKSMLKEDRPDRLTYFNRENHCGKKTSCCNGSQVVNLAWQCRHVYILDEYLEHTTGELPTEGV